MTAIQVDTYSGYRADQRPVRFRAGGHTYEVRRVEDQWYSPGAIYFKVIADDANRYVLRHDQEQDAWTLEAFRAGGPGC